MKKYWLISVVLGVALLASVALNGWMFGTLRLYRYNVDHGWFSYEYEGPPTYPVLGITPDDLKAMADVINSEAKNPDDRMVLRIEVVDYNTIDVMTGRQNGPLSGGGRIFRFNRSGKTWKLNKERLASWIS
jgi:hypothetical protein